MRALEIQSVGVCKIVDVPAPSRSTGETLIAPSVVGLCGTDLEMLLGTMPYLASGDARYPVRIGHEVSGVVVEADPDGGPPVGTRVTIDPVVGCGRCAACANGIETHCVDRQELGVRRGMPGGAADLVAAPTRNVHVVPEQLSLRAAVFVEPGVTAYNAVLRSGDVVGRDALVLGPGTLGCIGAQLLAAGGAAVSLHDPSGSRARLASELGLATVRDPVDDSYDVVLEAMGSPDAVHLAVRGVRAGGQIALTGVQPGPVDGFDANALVLKDATMFGVLNGPGLYDDLLDRFALGDVTPEHLIEAEFPLEDAEKAFGLLATRGRTRPKIQLRIGIDGA